MTEVAVKMKSKKKIFRKQIKNEMFKKEETFLFFKEYGLHIVVCIINKDFFNFPESF